jgi:hypothetical protein
MSGEWVWLKNAGSIHALEGTSPGRSGGLFDGRLDRHFSDNGMKVQYAVSWLVVHTLLTGEGGRYRDPVQILGVQSDAKRDAATLGAALGDLDAELQPDGEAPQEIR